MYTTTSTLATIALAATAVFAQCDHGTPFYKRQQEEGANNAENSVGTFTDPGFDYGATRGPVLWHTLDPANAACAEGRRQSPIDLTEAIQVAPAGTLNMTIDSTSNTTLINLGTTVELEVHGTTVIGNESFGLAQFHYHTPSEHYLLGEHFPAEVHFVHESIDNPGNFLVVGFVIEPTDTDGDALMDGVLENLASVPNPGDDLPLTSLNFDPILGLINDGEFFTYGGSLTTPPCSEVVTFYISKSPIQLRDPLYNALRRMVGHNSRYIQSQPGSENLLQLAGLGKRDLEIKASINLG
ncbi:carbonic anhydrase [Phlyctema vagabunda]|uniref:Carbonic anhydrase n=1 Tax=Phlyctema vagabunda TaxID=108571 RepID=A0ABR4PA86_9HELO